MEPTSPAPQKRLRPGWKSTLLHKETFLRLRNIQQGTVNPRIDLSYLTDACVQMALDQGEEAIVEQALARLKSEVRKP